ncbi:scrapie-responsive protein 1-like isoform X2 [Clarias gariepinus]|uniref:scrapie-responsive protein 1-like isoform X2 n=1 Tax=Clarias gariepinus TaxID=13013 RepID=UPI00234CB62F|nr:scrapie-responsive protein 1-like isoform X2 [Clarias gariepinus]
MNSTWTHNSKMKALIIVVLVLLHVHVQDAIPSNRWSCYRKKVKDRNCLDVGPERMRPIESLKNHYWEGNECDIVCYCNLLELLCCPRTVFFGSKISFVIPCKTSDTGL